MVVRTQVTLDAQEHRRAKERAAQLGISLAEYVRRLVASDLGGRRQSADPAVIFNLGDSGGSDVAARKDDYVGDAVEAESARSRGG